METIKKQNIANALRDYCARYDSQNRAAASLKSVSSATISQMLNGKWELIKDDMWRNVSSQIGYKDERWEAVETTNFIALKKILSDAKSNALAMAVISEAGTGKTFAFKHYANNNKQTYHLCCNEYWNRKLFLSELLLSMGKDSSGYTVGEMMNEAVRTLKMQQEPLIILDEADKLSDQVLYFFITLYNQLEDECGLVLSATSHLDKRLRRGLTLNKKGYKEIWSRIGRKCIQLQGVVAADIVAICEVNGIAHRKMQDAIIEQSEGDLRRVKRRIHAELRKQAKN